MSINKVNFQKSMSIHWFIENLVQKSNAETTSNS